MTSLQLPHSEEALHPSLALFQEIPVSSGIDNVQWIETQPAAPLAKGSPVIFDISPKATQYIDLKRTLISVKARITNRDGSVIDPNVKVGPVNLLAHALWSKVDISLQHKTQNHIQNLYPYKCIMDMVLNFGNDAKRTQLGPQMFYEDTGDFDSTDTLEGRNGGLILRAAKTVGSKIFSTVAPVYADIAQQSRYLLPGVHVQYKFTPSENSFRLMADEDNADYVIDIVDAKLQVCTVNVTPAVMLGQGAMLLKTPAIYPYMVCDIRQFNLTREQSSIVINDVFQNIVPSTLVLGMVSAAAFQCNY